MEKNNNDLLKYLKKEGESLKKSLDDTMSSGHKNSQDISEIRENSFNEFLERFFPYPHRIAKGTIHDSFGNNSMSIDSIIINPIHPHTVDSRKKFTFILADGVDIAIELKPDISKRNELERGLSQIRSVKKLKRYATPIPIYFNKPKHLIEHSLRIPTFIFSNKAKKDVSNTCKEIVEYYSKNKTPLEEQFDYVVINGEGIISNYKHPEISNINGNDGQPDTGIFFEEWRELTIPAFLARMNSWKTYSAKEPMQGKILSRYLCGIKPYSYKKIEIG